MPEYAVREKRRRNRFPLAVKVRVTWTDTGAGNVTQWCRCLDVSQTGIRVELEKAPPLHALVHIESGGLQLSGSAVVRHVNPKKLKFEAGLEFVGGAEWRAPRLG